MHSMSLRLKIGLFISALFVIALTNTSLVYVLDHFSESKSHWISRSNQIILTAQRFLGAMKDAETGQRGYLITHDTRYLEPYHNGLANAKTEWQKLFELTQTNSQQTQTLSQIKTLMERKFKEMAQTITLLEAGKQEAVLKTVKNNEGKQVMDEIRKLLTSFLSDEEIFLQKQKHEYNIQRAQVQSLMFFMMIVFFFMAILTFVFLNKTLFAPFNTLLITARKTEHGVKANVDDLVPKDEMGYLISSLYKMNEIVIQRTQELSFKALHDDLTQLKNRQAFEKDLPEALNEANKNQTQLALCFLDLNKFKPINDELGHDFGDAVLIETANKLKQVTRNNDIYRIGGDEFIIILKNIHSPTEAESFANRLISAFKEPFTIKDKTLEIGISLGIALYPKDAQDIQTLLKLADSAMYKAKKGKHSTYRFFADDIASPTNHPPSSNS